jgi:hypothetical protein
MHSALEGTPVGKELHIGAELFAALDSYVQAVTEAAHVAVEEGGRALHQHVQDRARKSDAWAPMADSIEMWPSKDGGIQVGVRNPALIANARKAEYGDLDSPPNPLFRTMGRSVRHAGERMDSVFNQRLGLGELR